MSYVPNSDLIHDEVALAHPSMRFSAVIAGWLVATATAGLLYAAGLALGFASFDAWNAGGSAKGIGTAVWMIVTWVAALFMGGMFAAWFDGRNDDTSGALHGVTVWGLSLTTTAVWLALGLGHAMAGHGGGMGGPGPDMHGGGSPALTPAVSVLDANISYQLTGRERGGSAPIVTAILAGQDDIAIALLAADTGTSQDSAASTLQKLTPEIGAARSESKLAADKAAHYLSLTLWIAFLSGFLALLASALGGWLGAGHIHRVYHLRKYPARHRVV